MTDLVSLRHLPDVDRIEAALVLAYADRGFDHDLDRRIRQYLRTTFGVQPGDLDPDYPEWVFSVPVEDWTPEQEREFARIEETRDSAFAVLDLTGAEAVEAWRALGWDVLDDHGQTMRAVERLGKAMAACAKGLCGRSMAELGAMAWAARQAVDRGEKPAGARERLNRSFLEFGNRRSRRRTAA